jgi:hypothetical protein
MYYHLLTGSYADTLCERNTISYFLHMTTETTDNYSNEELRISNGNCTPCSQSLFDNIRGRDGYEEIENNCTLSNGDDDQLETQNLK